MTGVRTFQWASGEVRRALGLRPAAGGGRVYRGVSTDSRRVGPGELFVALRGERFDGVEFVADAARAGASGAVVERRLPGWPAELEVFEVADARAALGALARHRRRALDVTAIAVTGTNGKTTVKEILGHLLRAAAPTYVSPGNFNNLVGVPRSILEAPADARFWVLELGTSQPGEIRALGEIAEPDVAVITSAAEGHLEGLRDLRGVIEEKTALLTTIREGGWAVVADDPPELAARARERFPAVRTAGLGADADEQPEEWSAGPDGIRLRWRGVELETALLGPHSVRNLLVALGAARVLNVPLAAAAAALRDFRGPPMRAERRDVGSLTLLVDCYNANPGSFRAAIGAAGALAGARPKAALVGSMRELGAESDTLHRRVAKSLVRAGFAPIGASGEFVAPFEEMRHALGDRLVTAADPADVYPEFVRRLAGDEVVLIKASRGVELERVLPWFERDFST